mgnify:CR=1 FL=1
MSTHEKMAHFIDEKETGVFLFAHLVAEPVNLVGDLFCQFAGLISTILLRPTYTPKFDVFKFLSCT